MVKENETLAEFVKRRMEELGVTAKALCEEFNIGYQTQKNIRKGKSLRDSTKELLARALQCSIGDINEALSNTPHPLRKEAAKPEGQAGKMTGAKRGVPIKMEVIDKLEEMVQEQYPDEEPAAVFKPDPMPEDDFPVYRSVYDEDREEGARNYRKHLKAMVLKVMGQGIPGQDTLEDVYADIGIALVKELNSYEAE